MPSIDFRSKRPSAAAASVSRDALRASHRSAKTLLRLNPSSGGGSAAHSNLAHRAQVGQTATQQGPPRFFPPRFPGGHSFWGKQPSRTSKWISRLFTGGREEHAFCGSRDSGVHLFKIRQTVFQLGTYSGGGATATVGLLDSE